MEDIKSINDVVIFQLNRRILSNAKDILNILENQMEYAQKLEKLLIQAGIEDFKMAEQDFRNGRKRVLDISNESIRELTSLIEKFDFILKK